MKLTEDKKLIVTQKEYTLVKKWNVAESPYIAGLYLFHELKRNGIIMEWDPIYFRDIYLAFRKKNVEIVEEEK